MSAAAAPGPGAERAPGWEGRYRAGDTPWDLGGPPPALTEELARRAADPAALDVLVPGAGRGHDALAWARAGARVTAVDIAPSACAALRRAAERAGLALRVHEGDVLALPGDFTRAFDLVWEQTCLCALELEGRDPYVAAVARALRPGGTFLGLFWHHGQPGGPPYDLSPELVRALFAARFVEADLRPVTTSAGGRRGEFVYRARPLA